MNDMTTEKQNKRPNVPPLRFPEFTEPWQRKKVSDILDFYSTNSLSWDQLEFASGDLKNLHYGMIHVGLPTLVDLAENELPNIKQGNVPRNYELCVDGDVAFADASEDTNDVAKAIELINTNGQQVVFGLHTIHGRDNKGLTAKGFKGYAFASKVFHDQIKRIAQGTKIFSISSKNFAECYIGLPTLQEQRKIAHLLSILDRRIAVQSKIIEDLRQLKSALVERLYGQHNPNYRIGDLVVQVSERNRSDNNYSVLSVNNRLGFIEQSEQFEDRSVASDDTSNYKVVSRNDFAYNPARINVGSIAQLTSFENGIVSPMYICFHTKRQLLPEYLEYFFDTRYFYSEMQKRLEGSVRLCLSWEGLCNIPIAVPPIEQQEKVGKRISLLADKISLEERHLDLLKSQKQYLLQAMFI